MSSNLKKHIQDDSQTPDMSQNNQMALYDPNQYIINNYLSEEQPGAVMQDAPTGMGQPSLAEGTLM